MQPTATKIDKHGRVVIPADYRRALGLRPGDSLTIKLDDGALRLVTLAQAIREAQEFVAKYVDKDRSLVAELIAERRAEAARE
ncbi:MAG: AbrB/MazE/SpoVT family DNA-binding domain-containing protein [Chloroflexota bacterium]|nr:AbrB/MazE/SpoVT family DNA-binding domain-containing protein [Chloroflexota bacterium]MDE2639505.1 AbrB/MazE/SpoVT family DNA-binding domain-containing protein [Chloroflexota bacterium]